MFTIRPLDGNILTNNVRRRVFCLRNIKAQKFSQFLDSINKPLEHNNINDSDFFVLKEETFQVIAMFTHDGESVTVFSVNFGSAISGGDRQVILEKLNQLNTKYTQLKFVISAEDFVQVLSFIDASLAFEPKAVLDLMVISAQVLKDELASMMNS